MNILIILLISLLIEALIQVVKPLWGSAKIGELSVTEVVSMAIGTIVAVIMRLNILADFIQINDVFSLYVFYVLTGMAMGRGTSFVHDIWLKLRSNYGDGLLVPGELLTAEIKKVDGDGIQHSD